MPFTEPENTDRFVADLLLHASWWDELDRVEVVGTGDLGQALAGLRSVVAAADDQAVLVRAADLLETWGRSDEALEILPRALAMSGAPRALRLAYARRLQAKGDLRAARRWMRDAALTGRPEGAFCLWLAELDLEIGYPDCALRLLSATIGIDSDDPAVDVPRGYFLWHRLQRPDLAVNHFASAYRRGYREEGMVTELGWLLTGEMRFAEVVPMIDDPFVQASPSLRRVFAMLSAHAKIAQTYDRPTLLETSRAREASPAWVALDRLGDFLADAIRAGEPFSWIRLGDGEGRFLIFAHPWLRPGLTDQEAEAIGTVIWWNWFGREIAEEDRSRLAMLAAQLDAAVANTDLLGITSAARFHSDTAHYGYSATIEVYARRLAVNPAAHFTETLFNYDLAKRDLFLRQLLEGLDFLGVISPHPDLAERLQRALTIKEVRSYDIPGEGRLERPRDHMDRGKHFPAAFDDLLEAIEVPFRGAVFIVAGGLLGKVYCDRIKRLGGIALDVGAIVDAWMGYNTRPGHLDKEASERILPA